MEPGVLLWLGLLGCVVQGSAPPVAPSQQPAPLPTFLGRHNTIVKVLAGDSATLACHIHSLGDKTVTWARRLGDDFHILTVGFQTYHNDKRYQLSLEEPNNWKLVIRDVRRADEGRYECQVSTHPPRTFGVNLNVAVPKMEILDPRGEAVREARYLQDDTVGLQCVVSPAPLTRPLTWARGGAVINTRPDRGIRVTTTRMGPAGLSLWLEIAQISEHDAGNYTCTVGHISASVTVTVLDGESSAAARQHFLGDGGGCGPALITPALPFLPLLLASLLQCLCLSSS